MKQRKEHTVGRYTFYGNTLKEARTEFDAAVQGYCDERQHMHIESRFGATLIIWRELTSWNYRCIWPDAPLQHGQSLEGSTCSMFADNANKVLQSVRMHAAQNAWNPEVDDAEHIRLAGLGADKANELARWISFQRRYATFRAQGYSDADCYDYAHGFRQPESTAA